MTQVCVYMVTLAEIDVRALL